MATTIQISENLKAELMQLKDGNTYEDVIKRLLNEHKRAIVAEQMREYGEKYSKEDFEEFKEWEATETKW